MTISMSICITCQFAQASLAEMETQLEIAARLKYISREQLIETLVPVASLGKQLTHCKCTGESKVGMGFGGRVSGPGSRGNVEHVVEEA
jgi:hypothetical protein